MIVQWKIFKEQCSPTAYDAQGQTVDYVTEGGWYCEQVDVDKISCSECGISEKKKNVFLYAVGYSLLLELIFCDHSSAT